MPGHFTHIYTARRVADYLAAGNQPDWPPEWAPWLKGSDPKSLGQTMIDNPKFTAIGAIGPDLFYFLQDYNSKPLGPISDELMLGLATYYYIDAASEDDWEPLLVILDGVNSTLAGLLRFLIKLDKIWQDFVAGWNATIGPLVNDATGLLDALTGGVLSQAGVVIDQLKNDLITLAEEELLTYKDIFTLFDTCVQKGYDEQSFLWSDMSHYRAPSRLAQAFFNQVTRLNQAGQTTEANQFLAFALGYVTHIGLDTVGHSFVNEQCGGPYRNHPQRHHLIENHIDAWNYDQTAPGKLLTPDPWGYSPTYPQSSMSALWFAVQMTPDAPNGSERPDPLPADPTERKKALDVDGEMPTWMAEAIVLAMMEAFQDQPHPMILGGSDFQDQVDAGLMTKIIEWVTGAAPNQPIAQLIEGIAPTPSFRVPHGFPLPWQIQTIYRVMITYYKLTTNQPWTLQKPQAPAVIIVPPASDVQNLFQPPDLGGIDPSNPIGDICSDIVSLFDWAVKELEAAGQLIDDIIKMLASPVSYPIRYALYELAMMVWDTVMRTHEILVHTGFFVPNAQQTYPSGELLWPSEIDVPLITLGGTVDSAFRQALAAATDPLGNLDQNQDVIGTGHSVTDQNYPYYPVLRYDLDGSTEHWEYRRPWAWPSQSPEQQANAKDIEITTPTEKYDPQASALASGDDDANATDHILRPGPYPLGTQPNVFFRLDAPVDQNVRQQYEQAQAPWDTDALNSRFFIVDDRLRFSPIGDPVPFSTYLIGQLLHNPDYATQFNLDSDRAFAYLTWDWIRQQKTGTTDLGFTYPLPAVPPEGAANWTPSAKLQLHYVTAPSLNAKP